MSLAPRADWDPQAPEVTADPLASGDRLRRTCPVAWSRDLGWSLFRHADVTAVLHDPATFSSRVSAHVSVPNGMDPPEHTAFRRATEAPFRAERLAAFEPTYRRLAAALVEALPRGEEFDLVEQLAQPFAARAQCAFLGWPVDLDPALRRWTAASQAATAAGDREALARLADDELVSVLRNWTVGEVGTIAAAVGIVAGFLAGHGQVQRRLRSEPARLGAATDEILRLHGPLVSNRRVATRPVELGGRRIEAGQRLALMWTAANRDGDVFAAPADFRLDRDPAPSLLYGAGIHVCPGAPLARLELRVLAEELLARTTAVEAGAVAPVAAAYPAGGWQSLSLRLR